MKDTLIKFLTRPGLCTIKELVDVKHFMVDLQEKLGVYVSASGYVPEGDTLDVHIKSVEWYINRINLK